jgi:DNA-binding transcriptional regulator YhcF (GntR family)
MLTIRLDSAVPLADQIAEGIRLQIAAGEVRPGDELPPVRQLAADLGVNLNTVARAYRELEEAGLVDTVRGRGTQVRSAFVVGATRLEEARRKVAERLRVTLADAKLAQIDRCGIESLFEELMWEFWQPQSAEGG